jgi:hypothetical protein
VDFEGAGDHLMRASLTHAVQGTAPLAQVTGRESGEREAASGRRAPKPAAAPECDAKIVRIGHAALLAGSIAHPGMGNENGVRLTIRVVDTRRKLTGGRVRRSPESAPRAAGTRTGASGAMRASPKLARAIRVILTIDSVPSNLIEVDAMDATSAAAGRQTAARGSRAQIPGGDGVYLARVETQADFAARCLVRPGAAVALHGTDPEAYSDGQRKPDEMRVHTPVQIDAPFTYDALYVIVDALKRANSIDAPKVLAAMPATGYTGVADHIAFDDKGGLKEGAIAARGVDGGGYAVFGVVEAQ